MTFGPGPRLLDAENPPDNDDQSRKVEDEGEEQGNENNHDESEEAGAPNEHTSLLPRTVRDTHREAYDKSYEQGKKH
jgi:hypothetical protein